MTVFIGDCMETEHRFLGTPSTKTESAFCCQGVVFFRLRPGKVMSFRFSFCNSILREASDDLTQPMMVNALEGALVEAFSNRFPSRSTAHQYAQMSVYVMRLRQSRTWLLDCGACCVDVHDECFLALSRITLKSARAANGSSGYWWPLLIRFKIVQKTGSWTSKSEYA